MSTVPFAVMIKYVLKTIVQKSSKPFVFGIIDNAIMVLVGDQLDAVLQSALHLSTMYAAGVGNAISDLIGEASSSYWEKLFKDADIPDEMKKSAIMKTIVVITPPLAIFWGCMVGMLALPIKKLIVGG
jgi:hypothetical protein